MKKILLGTTAIVAATFFASAAMAQAPKVTVGGFLDFQTGWVDEDMDVGMRDYNFRNDSEVHFMVDGKSDNGLGYGAVIELEADVSSDADGQGVNADKTYLYMEGNWGRTEMGTNVSAADSMKVDASTFARGTGGIDGDWYHFISGAGATSYIVRPDLPLAHGATSGALASGATEDATNITYYTPRFSGFQLGLSYIPDAANAGQDPFSGDADGTMENIFSAGVNYMGQVGSVGVSSSLTGTFGESEVAGTDDLQAYAFGLVLNYMGWNFGGSWGAWDEAGGAVAANLDGDYYTLGLGYENGPWGASLTWLDSEWATSNEFQNLSLGADYKLAHGLTPYAEINFFEMDTTGTASDNDGTVFLLGAELAF